jgi:hypothetical protein
MLTRARYHYLPQPPPATSPLQLAPQDGVVWRAGAVLLGTRRFKVGHSKTEFKGIGGLRTYIRIVPVPARHF